MSDFRFELDQIYDEVTTPLRNHRGRTNTLLGMRDYIKLMGEVMVNFADRMNEKCTSIVNLNPDKKQEVIAYLTELKNKLIRTYKPK